MRFAIFLHSIPLAKALVDAAISAGLANCRSAPGVTLFAADPPHPLSTAGGSGWLIGTRHERSAMAATKQSWSDDGEEFVMHGWGSYVAVLHRPTGPAVIRDPSGAVPVFYTNLPALTLCASDPALLFRLLDRRPAISRFHLVQHLARRDRRALETALETVNELLPGFALTGDGALASVWSPWTFAQATPPRDRKSAAQELHATIAEVVETLAAPYGRLLAGVSGGLDSSIVLACLAGSRKHVQAFTMAADDPDGDERPYARALTKALDVPLIERMFDERVINLSDPVARRLARPTSWPFLFSLDHTANMLANEHLLDAIVRGSAGDAVFCDLRSALPLTDSLLGARPIGESLETLIALARLTGVSMLRVGQLALKGLITGRRYRWLADMRYLTPDAAAIVEASPSHPWLAAPPGALPGKIRHVGAILRVQSFLDVHRLERPLLLPLYTQPVIELCLRIPTPWWVDGGRDRAIARAAFAGQLPASVLNRTLKGGPDAFAQRLFERRRDDIRALLLDGLLIRDAILDRVDVEAALSKPATQLRGDVLRLLALSDAEAWARYWMGSGG